MVAPLSRMQLPRAMTSASFVSEPEVRWMVEFEKTRPCTLSGLVVLSGVILMPSSPGTSPRLRMALPGLLLAPIGTTEGVAPPAPALDEHVTVERDAVEYSVGSCRAPPPGKQVLPVAPFITSCTAACVAPSASYSTSACCRTGRAEPKPALA